MNNGARIGPLDEITLKAAIFVIAKVIRQQLAKQARFHENHGAYYAIDVCKSMTYELPGKTEVTGSGGLSALLLPVLQRAQVYANQFCELALADPSCFADGAHVRRGQFGCSSAKAIVQ